MDNNRLSKDDFSYFVKRMPLVSIDLCVSVDDKYMALVNRKKPPASGYLFTPGGRIQKNEGMDQAIHRILNDELGINYEARNCEFLDVFEHFYEDSAFSSYIGTHYVCLLFSYKLESCDQLNLGSVNTSLVGHDEVVWVDIENDLRKPKIHHYALQNIYAFKKK